MWNCPQHTALSTAWGSAPPALCTAVHRADLPSAQLYLRKRKLLEGKWCGCLEPTEYNRPEGKWRRTETRAPAWAHTGAVTRGPLLTWWDHLHRFLPSSSPSQRGSRSLPLSRGCSSGWHGSLWIHCMSHIGWTCHTLGESKKSQHEAVSSLTYWQRARQAHAPRSSCSPPLSS